MPKHYFTNCTPPAAFENFSWYTEVTVRQTPPDYWQTHRVFGLHSICHTNKRAGRWVVPNISSPRYVAKKLSQCSWEIICLVVSHCVCFCVCALGTITSPRFLYGLLRPFQIDLLFFVNPGSENLPASCKNILFGQCCCFFFLENCQKPNQPVYEKQKINFKWPNQGAF